MSFIPASLKHPSLCVSFKILVAVKILTPQLATVNLASKESDIGLIFNGWLNLKLVGLQFLFGYLFAILLMSASILKSFWKSYSKVAMR